MDSITVHTINDLKNDTELPRKRKYTSKACSSCRKLKIRCRELEAGSGAWSCEHCSKTGTHCSWPDVDGRKLRRARSPSPSSPISDETNLLGLVAPPIDDIVAEVRPKERLEPTVSLESHGHATQVQDLASPSSVNETPHTVRFTAS